ncbi:hypothetical protein [Streptosporangium saharense]
MTDEAIPQVGPMFHGRTPTVDRIDEQIDDNYCKGEHVSDS